MESRFGGEPLLAGVQWSVGVFWDVEAAKERGNQGNRVQGFSRCWGARELGARSAALHGPRRCRGGDRWARRGGVARQRRLQRVGRWVQELVRAPREAETKLDLAGASQRGGRAAHGTGGERAERQTGEGEKGSICKFQNFQGPKCKTRITFKLKLKWKSSQHESCSIF